MEIKKVAQLFKEFIHKTGKEKDFQSVLIINVWKKQTENVFQKKIEKQYYYKRKIYVKISCSVLRHQMSYCKSELIQKVNNELGFKAISSIVFLQ